MYSVPVRGYGGTNDFQTHQPKQRTDFITSRPENPLRPSDNRFHQPNEPHRNGTAPFSSAAPNPNQPNTFTTLSHTQLHTTHHPCRRRPHPCRDVHPSDRNFPSRNCGASTSTVVIRQASPQRSTESKFVQQILPFSRKRRVPPKLPVTYVFPPSFQARGLRFLSFGFRNSLQTPRYRAP